MVVNSTDPGRFNEEETRQRQKMEIMPQAHVPRHHNLAMGCIPCHFSQIHQDFWKLLTQNLPLGATVLAVVTQSKLKTNPESDGDSNVSSKTETATAYRGAEWTAAQRAHYQAKAVPTKTSPLCRDLGATIPFPRHWHLHSAGRRRDQAC